jgi:hypothetical protein
VTLGVESKKLARDNDPNFQTRVWWRVVCIYIHIYVYIFFFDDSKKPPSPARLYPPSFVDTLSGETLPFPKKLEKDPPPLTGTHFILEAR